MQPVSLLIVGAGDRGTTYAGLTRNRPEWARVVGVAEPLAQRRARLAREHGIPEANVFDGWEAAAAAPRCADAVIIATPDALHEAPACAFAARGYHVLLEKPMAPTEAGCARIVAAVRQAGVLFAVCHVLRYTAYTRKLRELLAAGVIGDLVSVEHLEPVGFWHQAHSFVRGNWRNERESSCMLLAKSCHDLDWLSHLVGAPCRRVSSFGSLTHFLPANRPAGAADRCLDCGVEAVCPYSAPRFYGGLLERGSLGWPLSVVTADPTPAALAAALRAGPYGRCVYACDNDVVDHQVVNLEFAGGQTAVFTMTAFTRTGWGRYTRLFGTRGQIDGDSSLLSVYDFLTGRRTDVDTRAPDQTIQGGHGGGDEGVLEAFVGAVAQGSPALILSGADATLESHRMVFAAERARREGRVVALAEG